jgi:hypothetical protein
VVDGGGLTMGLKRGDGERERGREKLGGKWFGEEIRFQNPIFNFFLNISKAKGPFHVGKGWARDGKPSPAYHYSFLSTFYPLSPLK